MKVILLKDIKKQGKKNDIIDVNDGYGRNFLIKNNLAVPANSQNLTKLKSLKTEINKEEEKELETANLMKTNLEKKEIKIKIKAGKDGKVFGSVTSTTIQKELEKAGYSINKKAINLALPIKETGKMNVKVRLHQSINAILKIEIIGEKQ